VTGGEWRLCAPSARANPLCVNIPAMSRSVVLALALALPLTLTGCQEGSGEANGAVDLNLVGGPENAQITTTWEPDPEYTGMVRNTEDGQSFGQVPVGTYTITVERGGLSGTETFEVTEGETTDVTVNLE
jgi:hypothetical protein